MKKMIFIIAFACLGSFDAGATGNNDGITIEKITMETNPAGIGFGFWANHGRSREVFLDFGRRPFERYGFFSWNAIEAEQGKYNVSRIIDGVKEVHTLGSTCIISLNNISGPWFNQAKGSQIPQFYPQDIRDPKTREAGKKYIYTVIKELLPEVGDIVVCFDYEMMWHCRPDTEEKQKMLSEWFVEAAAQARRAAADVGMPDALKIIPIVNGSTEDATVRKFLNSPRTNHKPAKWLTDMVEVCDYLAIDSYDFDINNPTDPTKTLNTFKFWIDHYSLGKPVHITEFGYSTAVTNYPGHKTTYHATGTEEDQRDYYQNLFPMLEKENVRGGKLNGQVRSFCFWMYSDINSKKAAAERESHFGIVRLDGSHKPSFDVLKNGMDRMENSGSTVTSLSVSKTNVSSEYLSAGVPVLYTSGTRYEYLEVNHRMKKSGSKTLSVELEKPGAVLVCSGGQWCCSLKENTRHNLKIKVEPGASVQIYFTGGFYPFVQTVKGVELK